MHKIGVNGLNEGLERLGRPMWTKVGLARL